MKNILIPTLFVLSTTAYGVPNPPTVAPNPVGQPGGSSNGGTGGVTQLPTPVGPPTGSPNAGTGGTTRPPTPVGIRGGSSTQPLYVP